MTHIFRHNHVWQLLSRIDSYTCQQIKKAMLLHPESMHYTNSTLICYLVHCERGGTTQYTAYRYLLGWVSNMRGGDSLDQGPRRIAVQVCRPNPHKNGEIIS